MDRQIVFVHVPKTAGVSLHNAIRLVVGGESTLHYNGTRPLDLATISREHLHALRFISGHFQYKNLKQYIRADAILIAMVRDPVERLISVYNFISRPEHPLHARVKGRSFPEFVQQRAENLRSQMCRQLTGFAQAAPAIKCLRREYTLVGCKERLEAMVSAIDEIAGLRLTVRHDNRRQNVAPFTLDTQTARLLLDLTAEDRKLYDAIRSEPDCLLDQRCISAAGLITNS